MCIGNGVRLLYLYVPVLVIFNFSELWNGLVVVLTCIKNHISDIQWFMYIDILNTLTTNVRSIHFVYLNCMSALAYMWFVYRHETLQCLTYQLLQHTYIEIMISQLCSLCVDQCDTMLMNAVYYNTHNAHQNPESCCKYNAEITNHRTSISELFICLDALESKTMWCIALYKQKNSYTP